MLTVISTSGYIPSSTLLPSRRLETLVLQALEFQKSHCLFHNMQDETLSLFEDHLCSPYVSYHLPLALRLLALSYRDRLPRNSAHVLTAHTDEVWFVQFSHNGKFLASASKDKTAIIWSLHDGVLDVMLAFTVLGLTEA